MTSDREFSSAEPTPFPGSTGATSMEGDEDEPLSFSSGITTHRKSGSKQTDNRESMAPNVGYYGSFGERNTFLSSRSTSITESIANSVISITQKTLQQMRRRRFLTLGIFSFIIIVLLNVIFMPRTSLDRDLRRLHGEFLTFDDCTRLFLTQLTFKNSVEKWLRFQADELHSAGDGHDRTADLFKSLGYSPNIEKYETWLNTPTDVALELFASDNKSMLYQANLKETELFSFLPYSANGEVQTSYFYANYGLEEDFQELYDKGVPISGKIAIIRNGRLHPSLKLRNAEKAGVSGVILYSDPKADHMQEGNSPKGYFRNPHAVTKDTCNGIIWQPGDPTTPGWSSTLFSRRIKPNTISNIPAIPISWKALSPILSTLPKMFENPDSSLGNDSFSGNILHLTNSVRFKIKPIYNVIVEIKGVITDEEIIIGASGDVIGGVGGASNGFASLMEMARGFSELIRRGWKPLRTIKLICWDGSSFGQLGSTEYGEFYAKKLIKHAIVYINLDGVKGSTLRIETSPLYEDVLKSKLKDILTNDEGTTLWDYYKQMHNSSQLDLISQRIGDESVFQSHLGVPSVNIGFANNPKKDPVSYTNSKYDSVNWITLFDKSFNYHNWEAQYAGLFVLQLSEKEILNAETYPYISLIKRKFMLLNDVPNAWKSRRVMLDSRHSDYDNPTIEQEIDNISAKIEKLLLLSKEFDAKLKNLQELILEDYPWFRIFKKIKIAFEIKLKNAKVKTFDKLLVSGPEFTSADGDDGLMRGRKWFRHLVFAPNSTTGYTLEVLPGLSEALRNNDSAYYAKNLSALHHALELLCKKLH